ncbi:tetratricopeptide repeat protein 5-like isoform X1 [Rhodnius prolixus]|uniref:tetratricopeptide repeat protein 5-like isoform X1 n=1 Tax=Rhodnius prolixus TaxID=13249 RepID=UPI003D18CF1E
MASAFPNYDEEDADIREIVEGMRALHISPPEELQTEDDNTGVTVEVLGNKLKPICRLVDDLVKFYEEKKYNHYEVVKYGEPLVEIMLRNQEILIRQSELMFWMKLGQLYSLTKSDKQPAIDALTKVVTIDPNNTVAWNILADCYWDKKLYEKAQFCLEKSLKLVRSKEALRNMSAVCRELAAKYRGREKIYLQTGLNLAKEAVAMDVKDGSSWAVLGNAYLTGHLKLQEGLKSAKLALSAYKQAVSNGHTLNPELFYYQGYVNAFCENYKEALKSLDNAIALDGDNVPASELKENLLTFLNNIQTSCSNFGKLNTKRLAKLRRELQNTLVEPFASSLGAEPTRISSLHLGENPNLLAYGKVMWCAPAEDCLPFTCGLIEPNGQVFVTTVYNMVPDKKFFVGDTIFIPNPDYKLVNFKYNEQTYQFHSLRVDDPATSLFHSNG